jgi:FkbM family methyltransferase
MSIQAYLIRRNESTPIILFEPNLKLKKFLSQTFKNKPNIEINYFALGETNTQAWLKIQEKNSGTSKYVYEKYHSKNSQLNFKKIDIKTLDSLKIHFKNLLIKVDIEGGELAFLKGATETLNQGNEIVILTEFHSFNQEGLNFIEKNFRVLVYSRLRGRLIEIPSNRLKTLQNRFHWDLYLFDIVLIKIDSEINFTEVFVSLKERFTKAFRKYFY